MNFRNYGWLLTLPAWPHTGRGLRIGRPYQVARGDIPYISVLTAVRISTAFIPRRAGKLPNQAMWTVTAIGHCPLLAVKPPTAVDHVPPRSITPHSTAVAIDRGQTLCNRPSSTTTTAVDAPPLPDLDKGRRRASRSLAPDRHHRRVESDRGRFFTAVLFLYPGRWPGCLALTAVPLPRPCPLPKTTAVICVPMHDRGLFSLIFASTPVTPVIAVSRPRSSRSFDRCCSRSMRVAAVAFAYPLREWPGASIQDSARSFPSSLDRGHFF